MIATARPDSVYINRSSLWDRLRERSITVVVVACYCNLLFTQLSVRSDFLRWDILLFTVKVSLEMLFFVIRRPPKEFSMSPYTWAVTFLAVFTVMMLRPNSYAEFDWLGVALIQIGLVIHVLALLSLGRNFGVIPANRSIQTSGLYAFVRHPLYLSILITILGYWLCNPGTYNSIVVLLGIIFHVLRIREEEKLLLRDSEYQTYCRKTPWRVIPFVY